MTMNESVYNIQLYKKLVDLPYAAPTVLLPLIVGSYPRSTEKNAVAPKLLTANRPCGFSLL